MIIAFNSAYLLLLILRHLSGFFLGMPTKLKSLSFSKAGVNIMLNNPLNDVKRNILQYSLSLRRIIALV